MLLNIAHKKPRARTTSYRVRRGRVRRRAELARGRVRRCATCAYDGFVFKTVVSSYRLIRSNDTHLKYLKWKEESFKKYSEAAIVEKREF